MNETLPARIPSLSTAFEAERALLLKTLGPDVSAAQIVAEARRALDRAGGRFAQDVTDPNVHKAGLWLLEIVKAGAGILDRGADAHVTWQEVAKPKTRKWAGRGLFYGAAALFALIGYMEKSGLVIMTAIVLAALRAFDPKDWETWLAKIPFVKRPLAIEDDSGRKHLAQARITADTNGFVDSLTDALKTADHILLRLSEPQVETHWRDDSRLMGLIQGLLEAGTAQDGNFALKLIGSELESLLAAEGVEILDYSPDTEAAFDALPMLALTPDSEGAESERLKLAAPALKADGRLLKRGTVWKTR